MVVKKCHKCGKRPIKIWQHKVGVGNFQYWHFCIDSSSMSGIFEDEEKAEKSWNKIEDLAVWLDRDRQRDDLIHEILTCLNIFFSAVWCDERRRRV